MGTSWRSVMFVLWPLIAAKFSSAPVLTAVEVEDCSCETTLLDKIAHELCQSVRVEPDS